MFLKQKIQLTCVWEIVPDTGNRRCCLRCENQLGIQFGKTPFQKQTLHLHLIRANGFDRCASTVENKRLALASAQNGNAEKVVETK